MKRPSSPRAGFPWWFITILTGVGGRNRSACNFLGAKHSSTKITSSNNVGFPLASHIANDADPSCDANNCSIQPVTIG